ncbi:hypothetical protein J5N97_015486 [Dioscorea zingiberensis]|uniref:DYW domain-containing protein n=1 Tax=Dioscorea zingiberensis TaxID=325984 RepID=A0A9D5HL74_9LILI|nr:hypothetical protein J5N97_015486 [Dioscorea zingiberensis]
MATTPLPLPPSTQWPAPAPPPRSTDARRAAVRALDACASMRELQQHHSQLVRLGLAADNDAVGRLLRFLALSPSGDLHYALRVLRSLPRPDPFVFNTLLRSPSLSSHHHPLLLYSQMLLLSVPPNKFTFPPLLKALCVSSSLEPGKQVHAHVLKLGFHPDTYSQNNLINLYLTCGLQEDARLVFDKMIEKDVVSWTTMVSGCSRLGLVNVARDLFDEMPDRNSVSWNAMIAGYVQSGRFKEAFDLFERMREEGVVLDKFVAASMLAACTGLGALEQGKWIHGYIEQSGIELDSKLATTIIDMYCKCGCLEKAYEVFNGLEEKGLSSWNCMIGGFAMHGRGEDAIELYKEMEKKSVAPDDITHVNLLSACAHSGLVREGKYYFEHMVHDYSIQPKVEHFGCMVDLLGRAGLFEEAKKVIDEMPMEPDAGVLGALLGACRIHGNVELGDQIGRRVIELDRKNSGRYVLLANLYASAGRWDEVADMRKLMNDRGVNKEPGCSMIEMCGVVSEFIAGGKSHPQAKEIYFKVDEMLQRIKSEGYVPDTAGVLHDIDEEEKENPLYYHSEKLAIAYGLLHTKPGETIRISKNLRVCKDCHSASKLISKVFDRVIVVRDRNRFHHFYGGECSCKDYW